MWIQKIYNIIKNDVVILLKRETENVSGMLPEEGAEFPEVIKWYEELCREKFGAIKFNYMIMMMKDPFVHYHAFQRYEKNINLPVISKATEIK